MDPLIIILLPGLVGGVVIALLVVMLQRRGWPGASDRAFSNEPLSTDVINVSRIRVAGVGGLGLVAMAATVALNVPRIGQSLTLGLILGVVSATALIAWRWRTGPLPSSGAHTGANTTLAIDDAQEPRPLR